MSNTMWRKAWRDLWLRKARTLFVMGAIAISTFTLGTVLVTYHLLDRDMNASFLRAKPHHLSLSVDQADQELLAALSGLPGVSVVDARFVAFGRIKNADGDWHPLQLFSAVDLAEVQLDVMVPDVGPWPPVAGQISIERQALSVLGGALGDRVQLELRDALVGSLEVAGLVHDVVLPQAEWENIVYGYVSFGALQELGIQSRPNRINIALAGSPSRNEVLDQARTIEDWFALKGIALNGIRSADPGHHPHHKITSEMFLIMKIFGWFCCLFSAILVANLLTISLTVEKRQIGVMRAMGGHTGQIAGIYLAGVICLGGVAVAISVLFIVPAGLAWAAYFAKMMNFDIENARVPLWIFATQLIAGIGFPLLISCWPVLRASNTPIRNSLVDYGLGMRVIKTGFIDVLFSSWLSAPLLLSLRSTFRQKGRLLLNIGVLSSAAAFMISSFNIDATITAFVDDVKRTNRWDLRIRLKDAASLEAVGSALDLPEVTALTPFFQVSARIQAQHEHDAALIGIEPKTDMLQLPLLKGSQISEATEEVLISQSFLEVMPALMVGDTINVSSSLGTHRLRIAGITAVLGEHHLYVSDAFFRSKGVVQTNRFFVQTDTAKRQASQAIAEHFEAQGMEVASVGTPEGSIRAIVDHFEIIFRLIVLLTILLGVIGVNGIFSSMGASLLERTREFGILKAIGASKTILIRIIIFEGVLMGLVGWMVANLIALPMSQIIAAQMGEVLLDTPLPLTLSWRGLMISLILVPTVSALACLLPASKCANRPVRESLIYE